MRFRRQARDGRNELATVHQLRRDVDLGMLMAERLTAMGETGAAAAVLGEVANETREVIESRSRARRRLSRTTVVSLSVAAALGAGSAAAIVGTEPPSRDRPAAQVEAAVEGGSPDVATGAVSAPDGTAAAEQRSGSSARTASSQPVAPTAVTTETSTGTTGDEPEPGLKLPIEPRELGRHIR